MGNLNYQVLVSQIVRQLRGKRTQGQLNRKLKYKFNLVARWESGERRPKWSQFINLLKATHPRKVAPIQEGLHTAKSPAVVKNILRDLSGSLDANKIAGILGCSSSTVERWISGSSEPGLDGVLMLVHYYRHLSGLIFFLEEIVPTENLSHIAKQREVVFEQEDLLANHPQLAVTRRLLEIGTIPASHSGLVKHIEDFILVSRKEAEVLVKRMVKAKFIKLREGCYRSVLNSAYGAPSRASNDRIHSFWAEQGTDAIRNFRRSNYRPHFIASYTLGALTEEDFQKVCDLLHRLRRDIHEICIQSPVTSHDGRPFVFTGQVFDPIKVSKP